LFAAGVFQQRVELDDIGQSANWRPQAGPERTRVRSSTVNWERAKAARGKGVQNSSMNQGLAAKLVIGPPIALGQSMFMLDFAGVGCYGLRLGGVP
jgi:hypothetical protein